MKRDVRLAALGALTAASLLFGAWFSSPAEVMTPDAASPPAIVQLVDGDTDAQPDDAAEKRARRSGAARRFVQNLPAAVKALCVLPLWALGSLLIGAATALLAALGGPLLAAAGGLLLNALLLLGLFLGLWRLVFPHRPLRSFFRRRTFLTLVCAAAALTAAEALLPLAWEDYARFAPAAKLALGVFAVLLTGRAVFARAEAS